MGRENFEGVMGGPWGHSAAICAKTAESIEMTFELWAWMGPRSHVLNGSADPSTRRGNFEGEKVIHCKVQVRYSVQLRRRCGLLSNYLNLTNCLFFFPSM